MILRSSFIKISDNLSGSFFVSFKKIAMVRGLLLGVTRLLVGVYGPTSRNRLAFLSLCYYGWPLQGSQVLPF